MLALVLGLLGAILVYVTFSRNSGSDDGGGGGGGSPAVVAKENIPARTRITASMLEVRLIPDDARSELGYSDIAQVVGQAARFPISANEQVLSSKVVPLETGSGRSLSFVVPQGKRGFAIGVSQIAGAGGLVLPGDYVDVLVIYDLEFETQRGNPQSKETVDSYFVHTLFQNIEVLAVEQGIVDIVAEATPTASGQRVRNSEANPTPDAATVTLALTLEQAQTMYLAESNGRIRLALRPFGDGEERPVNFQVEPDILPANIPNPFLR
jgi:pilus assembly protein CpaB